ncbi:MAG: saccharopine dehydrogenase NADP-binding domain-containing protein [Bacteroidetes bacterium]|nr:saccharopine dehydrogenase NADP-binding domain-containing protein [Bacteroidota bacterium]MDA0828126.1 saccharopine dehydrogenase NADP-binding domain-containing protein [Bacteroidota bacterium]MDA1198635.1 saccharopine dehydrogenase NADP-binding domain-containing protein [Bacteroidota bacterium]
MKSIVVLGAGRSTSALIEYLATHSDAAQWHLHVVDQDAETLQAKCAPYPSAEAHTADLSQESIRNSWIDQADVVVSMLPAMMHPDVARACLRMGKHLVTASYASEEMKALDSQAREKGLIFLNECGVDPGIDHMSTMEILEKIRQKGGEITSYESFCGGILTPESPSNPWQYKFTWNPRNVVMAGAGGAVKFIQEGLYKFIPYHKLFRRTEFLTIPGYGRFEGYANRDSLKYISEYGLDGIPTMYRGTLRRPGFCRAWDVFVQLGATDDSYRMEGVARMTHRSFINSFLAYHISDSVELKLMHYLHIPQDSELMEMFEWLGLFAEEPVGLSSGTPAQVLQHILEKKWTMTSADTDMLVMWHRIYYTLQGQKFRLESSMVCKGKSAQNTAMAFTVGLPVAMATRLVTLGLIQERGVLLPMRKEVYAPILAELAEWGIRFDERLSEV